MNALTKTDQSTAVAIKETFYEAFVKLQADIRPAVKGAENEAFKRGGHGTRYADLAAVWEAIRGPLTEHGFGVVQAPQFEGETMWLETTLLHVSGDTMVSRYPLRPVKPDPQGFGSAITYAKRYALCAMLGVIADDDDDGNAASGVGSGPAASRPVQSGKITADQLTTLRELIDRTGTNIEAVCTHFKLDALPDMQVQKYATAIEMLNSKAAKANPQATTRDTK